MKIDKYCFDRKGRFYSFYISLLKWAFMFAFTIADWDFCIAVGKYENV